ncbi:hypothetical protein [Aliivibrio logei]|uniref:Uncharacterized protein n=1 Tax=Aliivibrio logei TaxID=688 RepID=A0A1B9NUX9_ALILO|nr:hypothetical protein [Aliivibrio logei]OCH17849.1 hypothetical protein A6E04_17755 [Aliivibrio logei]
MQYVGVILFIICIVHYVYQVIILPSFRQSSRDELFVLRDKLRARLIEVQDVSDKKTLRAFKEIDTGINRSLNRLHMLTFSNFVRITVLMEQPSKEHEDSRKKFHSLLENANDEMPLEIFQDVGRVLQNALAMNSLMFILYLSPFLLVIKFIASIYERIKYIENIMLDSVIIERNVRGQNCSTDKQLIA